MRVTFYESPHFEMLVQAMTELEEHYFGDTAAPALAVRESMLKGLLAADSGVQVVVAVDHERIAGVATVSLLYPAPQLKAQLFMKDLYVCKNWRGGGVGAKMMKFLASYAVSKGCVRFDWTTENTNTQAMSFYESLGAARVHEKV